MVSTTTQYTLTSSITTGGEYQCTVTNGAGNDTDNAIVNGEHWALMYSIQYVCQCGYNKCFLTSYTLIVVKICILLSAIMYSIFIGVVLMFFF